jgi:putative endonuclease
MVGGGCFVAKSAPRNDRLNKRFSQPERWLGVLDKQYYVYMMTNRHNTVLYTGVTNDLQRRAYEHRTGQGGGFTSRYNVNKLVWYEIGQDVNAAIAREKQIKGGSRKKKIALIEQMNPEWRDLYDEL